MTQRPGRDECGTVRDAMLRGCFEQIGREEAVRHMANHPECAQWAAEVILLTHVLAASREPSRAVEPLEDSVLESYLAGRLPPAERRRVEDACCHSLELGARLEQLRWRRWESRIHELAPGLVSQMVEEAGSSEESVIVARLDQLHAFHRDRPLAVAAAQAERSTFQTADGDLVISVVDRGPSEGESVRLLELGIRVHRPQWIGRWACYRIVDARGALAGAGLVKLEPNGNLVRLSVPPTEHSPYTVRVSVLDVEGDRLQELFERLPE